MSRRSIWREYGTTEAYFKEQALRKAIHHDNELLASAVPRLHVDMSIFDQVLLAKMAGVPSMNAAVLRAGLIE